MNWDDKRWVLPLVMHILFLQPEGMLFGPDLQSYMVLMSV